MNAFITVAGGEFEYEVNRSKFIAICRRVCTDAQANEILCELRKKYRDSTHICYAYVSGESSRSSDDGEPSGTAGAPIAECIRSADLNQTLVAVVRYFGGIKLGTGGLVRAYTSAANGAIAVSEKIEVADCGIIKCSFDYPVWKRIEKRSIQSLYKTVRLEYNKTVDVTYAVFDEKSAAEELLTLTNGKCELSYCGIERVERNKQE